MIDDRNRALAEVAHVDDVIVSDEIVSLILTQLSEDRRLEPVFADLLDEDGTRSTCVPRLVRPARRRGYSRPSWRRVRRGETAIGYASEALATGAVFGVRSTRPSRRPSVLPGDRVVVLAEA